MKATLTSAVAAGIFGYMFNPTFGECVIMGLVFGVLIAVNKTKSE